MGTKLDYLVIGNCILDKKQQDPSFKKSITIEDMNYGFKIFKENKENKDAKNKENLLSLYI